MKTMVLLFVLCLSINLHSNVLCADESIVSGRIRITVDLEQGRYSLVDTKLGQIAIKNAAWMIDAVGSSTDPVFKHKSVTTDINDSVGTGKRITITGRASGKPDLILQISVYDQGFVILGMGVNNLSQNAIRIKEFYPIFEGMAFAGADFSNLQMLSGAPNGNDNDIITGGRLNSANSILATFGSDLKNKHSFVIGGVTYHEFTKECTFNDTLRNSEHFLDVQARAYDPSGKKVEAGRQYMFNDHFYVDYTRPNPFETMEQYAQVFKTVQQINLPVYDFPTLCLWYAMWAGGKDRNTSSGAVEAMRAIRNTGWLKYSTVAVRLVPDVYTINNEQGWWDDEHWYKYGTYDKPYNTTRKWGQAIRALGGIPLTYSQGARRSEDFCETYPEYMLFNDAKKQRTKPAGHWKNSKGSNGDLYWSYDLTDPGFLQHMRQSYANLNAGGIAGLMFDYPFTAYASEGGFEDDSYTTLSAFRKMFELPFNALNNGQGYVSENVSDTYPKVGDASFGVLACTRHYGNNDTDRLWPQIVTRMGRQWYKNRVLTNFDLDSKNPRHAFPNNSDGVRAMFTMSYVVTGRIIVGKHWDELTDDDLLVISRLYPVHTGRSARPIDLFSGKKYPQIYDLPINESWHQVVFYNTAIEGEDWPFTSGEISARLSKDSDYFDKRMVSQPISVELGKNSAFGGLGLAEDKQYYIYDFWNDRFVGKLNGSDRLEQHLRPGEARVMSIHEATTYPQCISTNRHVMQGYVDMVQYPEWKDATKELTGTSKVVGGEPYKMIIATNGYTVQGVSSNGAESSFSIRDRRTGLVELTLAKGKNGDVVWIVKFNNKK